MGGGGVARVTKSSVSMLLSFFHSFITLFGEGSWADAADRAGTTISSCLPWFAVWEGLKSLSKCTPKGRNL